MEQFGRASVREWALHHCVFGVTHRIEKAALYRAYCLGVAGAPTLGWQVTRTRFARLMRAEFGERIGQTNSGAKRYFIGIGLRGSEARTSGTAIDIESI